MLNKDMIQIFPIRECFFNISIIFAFRNTKFNKACTNIPVKISQSHDIHWLLIDIYYRKNFLSLISLFFTVLYKLFRKKIIKSILHSSINELNSPLEWMLVSRSCELEAHKMATNVWLRNRKQCTLPQEHLHSFPFKDLRMLQY